MTEARQQNRIAYGFWRYGADEIDLALEMIETARAAGVTHLDTADVYGGRENFGAAETLLGAARRRAPVLFADMEIATKVGVEYGVPYNSSKEYIISAAEASLNRLGVDCVDLLYIHRPDLLAHPAEAAEAFDRLIAQGKVKSAGVSNHTPAQIDALSAFLKAPIAAHQVEFSLLRTAPLFDGTADQAMMKNIALYAWSPLAGGRLFDTGDEDAARLSPILKEMAEEKVCSPDVLALAFILRHPAPVTPIVGTKNPARLKAAAHAQEVSLARAEWYRLLEAAVGRRMP